MSKSSVACTLAIIGILFGVVALGLSIDNTIKQRSEKFSSSEIVTEISSDFETPRFSTVDMENMLTSAVNDSNGPLLTYTARPGMIVMWYTDVAPQGWVMCDGGTYNGMKTPDLRGRSPAGVFTDTPPGINYVTIGKFQTLGNRSTSIMLSENNLPAHNHQIQLHSMPQSGSSTHCLTPPNPDNYYTGDNPSTFYTSDNGTVYTHDYSGPITQSAFNVDTLTPCTGVYFIMKV